MFLLMMIPAIQAEKDCITLEKLSGNNIPCQLIAPFKYANPCNTYTIKFYNSTPEEIGRTTLTDYTGTDLCNTSFNFTKSGTYFFNVSSGDSGRIIVEGEDNMASLAIMGFFMVITLTIFWAAFKLTFSQNPLLDFIIRRGLYLLGVLFISADVAVAMNIAALAGLEVQGLLRMILIISQVGARVMILIMFFMTFLQSISMWKFEKQKKRMGEDG